MHSQVTKYKRQLCAGYQLSVSNTCSYIFVSFFLIYRLRLLHRGLTPLYGSEPRVIKGYFQRAYEVMHMFMIYSTYAMTYS